MDRLQSMRVFQQVVEEGGFAAAARRLGLAPAVVTRLVSDLEKSLGVRLLHRTTRRLSLTPAGEAYLTRLRAILAELDEAEAMVQAQDRAMSGTLRLCAPPAIAIHLLAPAAAQFQRQHPSVTVDITVAAGPEIDVGAYDLCVLVDPVGLPADTIVRPVGQIVRLLCASPDYLQRRGTPRDPAELEAHLWLRNARAGQRVGPVTLTDPTHDGRTVQVDARPVLLSNDNETLLRACLEGMGLSLQSTELVAAMLRDGRLVRVLAPWISQRMPLVAALPSRQFMPVRTRAFLDHLVIGTRRALAGAVADPPPPATMPAGRPRGSASDRK